MEQLIVIAHGRIEGTRRWRAAEVRLREMFGNSLEMRFTRRNGDARRMAREALLSGAGWLAVAGGDGTINEVLNGFFDQGHNIRPECALSFLPCGSGNDYVRMLGVPADPLQAAEALRYSKIRWVDVGLACFRGLDGGCEQRVFANIAEAGVGGTLVAHRDGWWCRTRFGYRLASLVTALAYRPYRLQMRIDGSNLSVPNPALSVIVAQGRYFGYGMHCAPMAKPDDGLLEAIVIGDVGARQILSKIRTFFSGTYLKIPKVQHYSARTVEVVGPENVYLELDGDMVGTLPATFSIAPAALQLRYATSAGAARSD